MVYIPVAIAQVLKYLGHKIPRGTFHLDVFFLYGQFTDLDVQSGFVAAFVKSANTTQVASLMN